MPNQFYIPTSAELSQIEQIYLPTLTMNDPIFAEFPETPQDSYVVIWEQLDNFSGLTQVRGFNGKPLSVAPPGLSQYEAKPGVYGEQSFLDEMQLTMRRQYGTFNKPVDVSDLVVERHKQMLDRSIKRRAQMCWTLLANGFFSATNQDGAVTHTVSYKQRVFTSTVPWGTFATATPLADLRAVKLLARGFSVDFGNSATLYVNQLTANNLVNNLNPVDIYGRRNAGLSTLNTLNDINAFLAGEDLPKIKVWDKGYIDSTGTFQTFIPANKAILCGKRDNGAPNGKFYLTRNVNAPGMAPTTYTRVFERGENEVPASIEVHHGWNGMPVLNFPSSIITMTVG